jgi:selenocysteine lyase/cysteine desulfurase
LAIRPGFEPFLATTREGGTGHMSEVDGQPDTLPEKYEAGSHNTIGIVGLSEAVRFILTRTPAAMRAHERALVEHMLEGLRSGGIRTEPVPASRPDAHPATSSGPLGGFSLVHDHLAPTEIAAILESHFGILARAGLHCAPRAHATVGTLDGPSRGAVRLSLGPFVTHQDISRTLEALVEIGSDAALLASAPRASVPAMTAAPLGPA